MRLLLLCLLITVAVKAQYPPDIAIMFKFMDVKDSTAIPNYFYAQKYEGASEQILIFPALHKTQTTDYWGDYRAYYLQPVWESKNGKPGHLQSFFVDDLKADAKNTMLTKFKDEGFEEVVLTGYNVNYYISKKYPRYTLVVNPYYSVRYLDSYELKIPYADTAYRLTLTKDYFDWKEMKKDPSSVKDDTLNMLSAAKLKEVINSPDSAAIPNYLTALGYSRNDTLSYFQTHEFRSKVPKKAIKYIEIYSKKAFNGYHYPDIEYQWDVWTSRIHKITYVSLLADTAYAQKLIADFNSIGYPEQTKILYLLEPRSTPEIIIGKLLNNFVWHGQPAYDPRNKVKLMIFPGQMN